ncbi:hypothetical protein HAHE_31110 [Haloferula helveola]|uniref:Peptidase S54 rhomboid domain-containing protein n=1 Tax=Haloferula helveola TaxID=490095 RepID=A0ABN6H6S6_9BACT|nr:hypothetical protein HAHE_31110 [Haloferula helveola]
MHRPDFMSGRVSRWRELGDDVLAAKATLLLVLVLTGIQLGIAMLGGVDGVPAIYQDFGLSRAGILRGQIWQLATHGFLHGGWLHLGLNVAVLLAVGTRIERIGGFGLWWRVLLAGLLAGGAMHLVLGGAGESAPCLVGASGAAVAAMLWLTGVSPGSKMWPVPLSGQSLGYGLLLSAGLLAIMNPALGVPLLGTWGEHADTWARGSLFGASHACHFGGGMAGFLGARWTLRPRVTLEKLQRDRRRREGA